VHKDANLDDAFVATVTSPEIFGIRYNVIPIVKHWHKTAIPSHPPNIYILPNAIPSVTEKRRMRIS
jgi:hypothetical protein